MITMQEIITIEDATQYKLHLADISPDGTHPLDAFVAGEWLGWNEYRGHRNDWTRDFIFSLIRFYPKKDAWLFGGIFSVIDRHENRYELDEVEEYKKYVGRVIVSFHRYQGMMGRDFLLENFINEFTLREILPSVYTGETFPGFENISHDFHILEAVFRSERSDWKAALSSIKGVYVISDKENGKQYVGSAYGDMGIWSRWACYIGTGHGWNDELTRLINEKTIEHARKNFRFSLVEIMKKTVTDETVRGREAYWKHVLLSKEHGYNRN